MISNAAILSQLSDSDIAWIARRSTRKVLPAETDMIRQGEVSEVIYFMVDGEAAVVVDGVGEVARLGGGDIIGEISLLDEHEATASVITQEISTVLLLRKDLLEVKLEEDLAFASRFYHALAVFCADRLRHMLQRIDRVIESIDSADSGFGRTHDDERGRVAAIRIEQLRRLTAMHEGRPQRVS
jgi:CRP/FNR family transcriptional regulator, cyclic AMP receptor protein